MIQGRKLGPLVPPGADRLARIRVVPGLVGTTAHSTESRLLLVHESARWGEDAAVIQRDMLAIATGLGLTPGWGGSQHTVRRASLTESTVVLDYGHDQFLLQGEIGDTWFRSAVGSGRIHVAIALDPRPDERTDPAVHLADAKKTGRLWSGIAAPRVAVPRRRR